MIQRSVVFGPLAVALRATMLVATAAVAACGGGGYGGGGGTSAQAPTVALSVAPTTISLGGSATLTWSASAGSSCTASGGWSGAEANNGTLSVAPTNAGTTNYTLACRSSGGAYGNGAATTTRMATLTVTAAAAYSQTALVSDSGVGSRTRDANVVNPWGLAAGATTPIWVANNRAGTATAYDGNGVAQPHAAPLHVSFPTATANGAFDPTGIVHNASTTDFVVTAGGRSATAAFIFAGENGQIGAWSAAVDPANVVTTYADAGGAVYKGLAIAPHGAANFLYATDFHNGRVDVFDSSFSRQATSTSSFAFVDPSLPQGYAPFGIQAIGDGPAGATQLYVSYAQQALPDRHVHVTGAGLGIVDVYDTNGALVRQLVPAAGALNAPWGMTVAPADFGALGGKLLVGNVGDGKINAFDPTSGRLIGAVADATGATFASPGLWGIGFGNDAHNQPHNSLFYSAGINDGANGVVGRIDVGATAPVLGTPPVVGLTTPTGTVSGIVPLTATAVDPLGITGVQFLVNGVAIGALTTAPYVVPWDSTTAPDGTALLNAKATDPDGNVAVSAAVTVTVANHTAATTLTEIQAAVFTPICSGCHSGTNPPSGALPSSQNLTAGHSFANLVSVASHEQSAVLRVKPGDPANSYIIQKLEGTAGINGQRMPLGGPYLDQATIDTIKSWIAAGAGND